MKAPRIDRFIITLFLLMSTGCGGLAIILPFALDTRGTSGYLLASLGSCIQEYPPDDEFVNGCWFDVEQVRGIAFDQIDDVNKLYVGTLGYLSIYNNVPKPESIIAQIPSTCGQLGDVLVLETGDVIASCPDEGKIVKFNAIELTIDETFNCCDANESDFELSALAIAPDGTVLAGTNGIRRFDPNTGEDLGIIVELSDGATSYDDFEYGPDGNLYVVANPGIGVVEFDGDTLNQIKAVIRSDDHQLDYVTAITFSPEGDIVIADKENFKYRILKFDSQTSNLIETIDDTPEQIDDDGVFFLAYRP